MLARSRACRRLPRRAACGAVLPPPLPPHASASSRGCTSRPRPPRPRAHNLTQTHHRNSLAQSYCTVHVHCTKGKPFFVSVPKVGQMECAAMAAGGSSSPAARARARRRPRLRPRFRFGGGAHVRARAAPCARPPEWSAAQRGSVRGACGSHGRRRARDPSAPRHPGAG